MQITELRLIEWLGDGSKPVPIFVKIEKPRASKRFLGGFRHKKTLTEYHNASCQTIDLRLLQKGLDRVGCCVSSTYTKTHSISEINPFCVVYSLT